MAKSGKWTAPVLSSGKVSAQNSRPDARERLDRDMKLSKKGYGGETKTAADGRSKSRTFQSPKTLSGVSAAMAKADARGDERQVAARKKKGVVASPAKVRKALKKK